MSPLNRRGFLAASTASAVTLAAPRLRAQSGYKVVIVGGGIGGATAGKYIKMINPEVDVTIIERDKTYYTCPRSNDVVTGYLELDDITFNLDTLKARYGLNTVYDEVAGVDFDARVVRTQGGTAVPYDRLILSPGIQLMYDEVWGWSEEIANTVMPHGWKAGTQTLLMRKQFETMREGGTVVICAPPNPYRCPPGPYERASMMTEILARQNPKGKVIILDPKNRFTKDVPFKKGWERLYGFGTDNAMIEWISEEEGGAPLAVNPQTMEVETAAGTFKGDMVNVIPPMRAGKIVAALGLTNDSGWCPVNPYTLASDLAPNTHVIGDSCIAGEMPKSGYSANSHAKMLAQVIRAELAGQALPVPTYANACYSLVSDNYGVSIADIFAVDAEGKIVKVGGGVSPIDDAPNRPVLEAIYQKNWHRTFAADVFS